SYLKSMGLRVSRAILTQTVRQATHSGILYNATSLRRAMKLDPLPEAKLTVTPFADVVTIPSEDLESELNSSYSNYGVDDTILITRSNKRAMEYNLAIRSRILEKEEVITVNEPILIAKNNYFWTSKAGGNTQGRGDFIANGDIGRITRIYGTEIRGMLRFADVQLSFPDRDLTIDAKLILNSLNSETAGLNPNHEQDLINLALRETDSATLANQSAVRRILKADPYFNALRVKYAYAVTCHKAQGGQWPSVFVDTGYIAPEALKTIDFYRWLYTASTRATDRLTYIQPTMEVR
ncbi:MAG: ATP-binding domain-containing protein, partial [Muribaculaceae bacterium]|nr:ATP-binding domain-containing protein [Muribaculaceae bacterium]